MPATDIHGQDIVYNSKKAEMKNIIIRKDKYFTSESKVIVRSGSDKIWIKGYRLYTIPVDKGKCIFATHLWTGSNIIEYENLSEKVPLLIRARLGRGLALISLIVFLISVVLLVLTKSRWSVLPVIPVAIYIIAHLTILRNRYLIIEKDQR
jgi:hypothetical protein